MNYIVITEFANGNTLGTYKKKGMLSFDYISLKNGISFYHYLN